MIQVQGTEDAVIAITRSGFPDVLLYQEYPIQFGLGLCSSEHFRSMILTGNHEFRKIGYSCYKEYSAPGKKGGYLLIIACGHCR